MFTQSFYLKFLKLFLPLFIIALPLANRDVFSIVFSRIFPSRLILILLIAVGGLAFLFYSKSLKEKKDQVFRWIKGDFLLKLLLLLFLIRLVSIKNSLNLKASFNLLLFYASVVSLYLILKFIYERENLYLKKLLNIHLVVVSGVALYGLLQLGLSFFGIRLPGVLVGSTFVRIPGTFYDANHLPAYLITAFPAVFMSLFYVKKDYQKLLVLILLSVFAFVLLFTFSRSGFLSFLVAFLILSFVFLKRRYWRKVLFVSAIFVFFSAVIFLTSQTQLSIFKRLSSVFNVEDKSTVAHGLLAYGSFELFKKSPIIGLGYGSFSEHFRESSIGREHAFFDTATQVRIPAHSIWLEVLVETGILGFLVYLWLILTILEKTYLALRRIRVKQSYLVHLALLASLIGILVSGLFYSYNLEFFWFFLFLVYFLSRNSLENSESELLDSRSSDEKDIPEPVAWKSLFYYLLIMAVGTCLIFYKLGVIPIRPGDEGLAAKIGWDMRRDWGYGVKNWWLPSFNNQVLPSPPLPFWLNALWTFLFDLASWVPRFFPALFGWLGLAVFYLYILRSEGNSFAFFSVFLLLSIPSFLTQIRYGGIYGYIFFFSCSLILLLKNLNQNRKFIIVPLIFLLSMAGITSYEGYTLLLFMSFIYFIYLFRREKNLYYLVLGSLLFISSIPVLFWLSFVGQTAPGGLVASFSLVKVLWILPIIFMPISVYLLSKLIYPNFKTIWMLVFILLIVPSFYFSLKTSDDHDLERLVEKRTELNRDGRVPLYLSSQPQSNLYYYSQVPLIYSTDDHLLEEFKTESYFFAIFDGESLRKFRQEKYGSFNSVNVSGRYVLIERPGKIN